MAWWATAITMIGLSAGLENEPTDAEPVAEGPVAFHVDATKPLGTISPWIYGTNDSDAAAWEGRPPRFTWLRLGGNRWTAYNWENNASNAGQDWRHQNDGYLGGAESPGAAVAERAGRAHKAGAPFMATIPIQGYVAADKAGDGDVANSGPDYLQRRFQRSAASKKAPFADPPDLADGWVFQDEFVAWLEKRFPHPGATDPPIFYSLDNEPDLWHDTHPRVRPYKATYADLAARTIEYAGAIKNVAPKALVFGPAVSGWMGMIHLSDAPDARKRDFLDYYLSMMKKAEEDAGRRLLDVLAVHWYSEARGGGLRVTEDHSPPATAAARVQAPRSLWDPKFREESWIVRDVLQQPIHLLPRLQEKIAGHYPGTKLAITEYYFGGGLDVSGALAQVDALGLFGRHGLFAACLYRLGKTDDRFVFAAFDLYRNYDGKGSTFGDQSLEVSTSDSMRTSVYAAMTNKNPHQLTIVAINKETIPVEASATIVDSAQFIGAERYQITSDAARPVAVEPLMFSQPNTFVATLPARSATLFVLNR